jgi:hypothetical protein
MTHPSPPTPDADHPLPDDPAASLRGAAFAALHADGLLDGLRASLRAGLIQRLAAGHGGSSSAAAAALAAPPPPTSLHARAADAMVANHLRATGRDLTLAVFAAEGRLGPGAAAVLAPAQLASLCRLDAAPALGAAVADALERSRASGGGEPSFAACLLAAVADAGGSVGARAGETRRRPRTKGGRAAAPV